MSAATCKVLLADNNLVQRQALGQSLRELGFACHYSALSEEMLAALRQYEPSVLLMALAPHEKCRSFEVEQTLSLMLAARCQRVGLPVVALLEEGVPGLAERALCLGMMGCVSRTASADEVSAALLAAIEDKNAVDLQATGQRSLTLGISSWRNQTEAWA